MCAYTGMSWNKYHRFTVIDNFVKCLAAEYPDKAERFQIGTSYEGRKMNLLRISNNLRSVKRAVWIDGGIHAREWVSPKVPSMSFYLDFIQILSRFDPDFIQRSS